jgi:hypothetical protein
LYLLLHHCLFGDHLPQHWVVVELQVGGVLHGCIMCSVVLDAGRTAVGKLLFFGKLLTLPAADVSYCRCSLFLIVLLVLLSVVSVCLQGPHHTCGHHLEAQAG